MSWPIATAKEVIHRDIQPASIVICPNSQAVLVDFGLVKPWGLNDPRTRTVVRGMGRPEYAPPEQYTGGTGTCSDLYSLGAIFYHALTGSVPPTASDRIVNPASFYLSTPLPFYPDRPVHRGGNSHLTG
ncbi:MAG: protein kinase domain-containing protein [Anaerolineae bacterium]